MYVPLILFQIDIHMNGEWVETYTPPTVPTAKLSDTYSEPTDTTKALPRGTNTYRIEELAYTRSGDKGNNANIGIISKTELQYLNKRNWVNIVKGKKLLNWVVRESR